jgi:hypothetical protein
MGIAIKNPVPMGIFSPFSSSTQIKVTVFFASGGNSQAET